MKELEKHSWASEYGQHLDYGALVDRFSPPERYRVSERRYPAGDDVHGATRDCKCFVLSGECEITMTRSKVHLQSGEYADLPKGTYRMAVGGSDEVYMVMVWEIPESHRPSKATD